jgi:hypothetical protein
MKNFAHQYNKPEKFRKALEAIEALRAKGKDPGDEFTLGAELARRSVYNLGGEGPLRKRLAVQRRKPSSNQVPRAVARETTRTLRDLRFIDEALELTSSGRALLGSPSASDEERALWRAALLGLTLEDKSGNASHPVLILLRLVERWPIYHRDGMELALEAKDDGQVELDRVLRLLQLSSDDRLEKLGVSKSRRNNARKIFPALAEHAGLIEQQSTRHPWTLTQLGKQAVEAGGELGPSTGRQRSSRGPLRFRSAPRRRRAGRRSSTRSRRRALSPAEQAAAEQLLYERTERHEDLVDRVMDHLPSACKAAEEDRFSFDLLVDPGPKKELVLLEMKTLESDEVSQARRAVGQLLFYEKVVVPQNWPDRKVLSAAVFEAAIAEELSDFLQAVSIGSLWCDEVGLHPLNRSGRRIAKALARGG